MTGPVGNTVLTKPSPVLPPQNPPIVSNKIPVVVDLDPSIRRTINFYMLILDSTVSSCLLTIGLTPCSEGFKRKFTALNAREIQTRTQPKPETNLTDNRIKSIQKKNHETSPLSSQPMKSSQPNRTPDSSSSRFRTDGIQRNPNGPHLIPSQNSHGISPPPPTLSPASRSHPPQNLTPRLSRPQTPVAPRPNPQSVPRPPQISTPRPTQSQTPRSTQNITPRPQSFPRPHNSSPRPQGPQNSSPRPQGQQNTSMTPPWQSSIAAKSVPLSNSTPVLIKKSPVNSGNHVISKPVTQTPRNPPPAVTPKSSPDLPYRIPPQPRPSQSQVRHPYPTTLPPRGQTMSRNSNSQPNSPPQRIIQQDQFGPPCPWHQKKPDSNITLQNPRPWHRSQYPPPRIQSSLPLQTTSSVMSNSRQISSQGQSYNQTGKQSIVPLSNQRPPLQRNFNQSHHGTPPIRPPFTPRTNPGTHASKKC